MEKITKTITVKTKMWTIKTFENATFTRKDGMVEIYQKWEWSTKITYFMQNNIYYIKY